MVESQAENLHVTPFGGTTDELQKLMERVWSEAYAGKMAFPVWTSSYLDWQFAPVDDQPNRQLAVYDQDTLVAVLMGTPFRFRVDDRVVNGAHWSWLTVDSKCRGSGLATMLDEARVKLEQQSNADLIVSYRFTGSKHSLAEKPNDRFPLKRFARRLGFWVRALDLRKLQAWNINSTEAFFSGLAAPFVPEIRSVSRSGCRLVNMPDDNQLEECMALLGRRQTKYALAIEWNLKSLRRQLCGSSVSQTVVAEVDGRVMGFVNFHILPFQGRTRELIGIIDLMVLHELPSSMQRAVIKTTLASMRQQGAILAMKLRCGDEPTTSMFLTGFIPRLPDSSLVLQWTQQVCEINQRGPIHLLWR